MSASSFSSSTDSDPLAIADPKKTIGDPNNFSPFAFPRPTDDAVRSAKIMIVDDEIAVVQLVRKYLRAVGFQNFHLVSDPTEAMSGVASVMPDLVLLDLRMKPVTGLEILEFMRRNERTQHIHVIVLTSATNEEIKITALNMGANDFLTKPVFASELVSRVRNTLSVKAYRDLVTDYSVKLESDVLRDALTGIANRRAFEYELKRRISEWNRQRTPVGLLMIDVDHFKSINDRFGHRLGDAVLHAVAKTLTSAIREMDLVARYGGEEFGIILPSTTIADAKEAAERARKSLAAQDFSIEEHKIELTASVGIANAMSGDDADLFVRRADMALYAAKRNGRNCCFFHDGSSCVAVTQAHREENSVRDRQVAYGLERPVEDCKIAIVDDEVWTIAVVKKYLQDAGFQNCVEINDSTQALETIHREQPDLVLLDIQMPHVSGLEILQTLRIDTPARSIPVLIFTSASDTDTKVSALELGATDFLQKPVDASELLARVRNTLLAKSHFDNLADYSNKLEHEVRLRTTELSASRREAIQCLARAAELRDDETGQHVLRVGRYAAIVARELGFSEERVVWMEHAAQLHDVGKIGIPDAVLNKPGPLNAAEYELMKTHCAAGTRIIRDEIEIQSDVPQHHTQLGASVFHNCNSPIMRMAALVAESHHEKWDGSGYPLGLAGKEIAIEGRITAVADVFDALSTERPYKKAIPLEKCFQMMEECRGSQFDPDVLDAFFRCKSEVIRTYNDYGESSDQPQPDSP